MRIPVPGDSALVILTPKTINGQIDRWRQAYDPNYPFVPSHITVAYPPFVPREEWRQVRSILVRRFSHFWPFEVTIREPGTFAGSPAVLWLRPEAGGNISRLHGIINEQLPSYAADLPFDYVPHLTLGFFDDREALLDTQAAVAADLVPIRFQVRELVYVVLMEDGQWCDCGQVSLGGIDGRGDE